MHLRLRKCKKSPQTYRKLADLRLRNTSCSFAEFAVAELSLNLRCPALTLSDFVSAEHGNKPMKGICRGKIYFGWWCIFFVRASQCPEKL